MTAGSPRPSGQVSFPKVNTIPPPKVNVAGIVDPNGKIISGTENFTVIKKAVGEYEIVWANPGIYVVTANLTQTSGGALKGSVALSTLESETAFLVVTYNKEFVATSQAWDFIATKIG